MSNECPVCRGNGTVLAFGLAGDPTTVKCPECAALPITPASAEDDGLASAVRATDEVRARFPRRPVERGARTRIDAWEDIPGERAQP